MIIRNKYIVNILLIFLYSEEIRTLTVEDRFRNDNLNK